MDPNDPMINLVKSETDGSSVPKILTVKHLYDAGIKDKIIRCDSEDIKVLGAKTYDEDWRLSLKQGDVIDCLDIKKVWREATVVVEERRAPGSYSMPMV
jgi:hypothetical protein